MQTLAYQRGNVRFLGDIFSREGLDPNGLVDGKSPLFVSVFLSTELLLIKDANPFIECDGALFYERDSFFNEEFLQYSDGGVGSSWLIHLHRKGFDIFKPGKKSRKWLVDYLRRVPGISFNIEKQVIFPTAKLTKHAFEVLIRETSKINEVIDEEGNTIADAIATTENCISKFENLSLSALDYIRNKANVSVLDLLIRQDEESFSLIVQVQSQAELNLYLYACGFFKTYGFRITKALCDSKGPQVEYLCCLIDERGVSLDVALDRGFNLYCLGQEIYAKAY